MNSTQPPAGKLIHAGADLRCRLVVAIASPGQRSDARGFLPVMDRLRLPQRGAGGPHTRLDWMLGDKGYSSAAIRAYLRVSATTATIPVKDDQVRHRRTRGPAGRRPPDFAPGAYQSRNTVERAFNCLKRARAMALRNDKPLYVYTITTTVATIDLWLRDLTQ